MIPTNTLQLPPSMRQFVSSRYDETLDYVTRHLAPHRMEVARDEGLEVEVRAMALGDLDLIDIGYGADVRISSSALEDCFMVHASATVTSQIAARDGTMRLDPGSLHVASPGNAPVFSMPRGCRHIAVRIPAKRMYDRLTRLIDRPARDALVFEPGADATTSISRAWHSLLGHLLEQATVAPEAMGDRAIADHYGQLLVSTLLNLQPSNYSGRLEQRDNTVCPWHVRRARAIIEDSVGETIVISELASAVKVSPRCLQNGFRHFLGVTPVEYVRNHRLSLLHKALQEATPDCNVTDLMIDRGITNFGRFAGYYRERYGCSPSITLKRSTEARGEMERCLAL